MRFPRSVAATLVLAWAAAGCGGEQSARPSGEVANDRVDAFGNQLGDGNPRIRSGSDGRVLVWASGDVEGPDGEWYDFTGAPFPPEELQYGIGKDRIRAIDDPLFVSPNDPRLLSIPPSRYRNEPVETMEDIMVIGYVMEDEPRAYPTALLDRHEVVNDEFKGKPVAVGW